MFNKKLLLLLASLFLIFFSLPNLSYAQQDDATSSSSLDEEEIKQSIQDRIKKAIENNLESAQEVLDSAGDPKTKAFIGTVESISQNSISINTTLPDGTTGLKQVTITPNSKILKNNKEIEITDIGINDDITAMGVTSDDEVLEGIRVIISAPTSPAYTFNLLISPITQLDTQEDTLQLNTSLSNLFQPFDITKSSTLYDFNLSEIDIDQLSLNQQVAAIVLTNPKKETSTITELITLPNSSATTTPTSANTCGDGICQDTVCMGQNCPTPESPQNCPADCQ